VLVSRVLGRKSEVMIATLETKSCLAL
jgi:hypothetical protein